MNKTSFALIAAAAVCLAVLPACTKVRIPNEKREKIGQFLKQIVADALEKDYRSHHIDIHAHVTDLKIDGITRDETAQDTVYAVRGRVTYRIEGKRMWKDEEGNTIVLGPEQDVTHWFTCGVLEDKYLHTFFLDDGNRLALFADNPLNQH